MSVEDIITAISNISINDKLNVTELNGRIDREYCGGAETQLTDVKMMHIYRKQASVEKKIRALKNILENHFSDKEKITAIIDEYMPNLVSPGTKGCIRGNKFNKIVESKIKDMKLDPNIFEVKFEKKYNLLPTNEIPDWFIVNKKTKKVIIGMNQLTLWGGGAQYNRGGNYIINNPYNSQTSKLLCVVCRHIKLKNKKNPAKVNKLFEIGFANDTLCYLGGLNRIITKFLKSPPSSD